jgi:hypothetical protein
MVLWIERERTSNEILAAIDEAEASRLRSPMSAVLRSRRPP